MKENNTIKRIVLILVVVEDGLGANASKTESITPCSLNPCFTGRWSRSCDLRIAEPMDKRVLILVVVEAGLGGR